MNYNLKMLFILLVSFLSLGVYGQEVNPEQRLRNFYRNKLRIDSSKAELVIQIQNSYKSSLKLLDADTSLNDAGRRLRIQAFMDIKNRQLEKLLTPAQQAKIIPSTERIPSKVPAKP